jgi:prepilin-type N-terminal cleavage/methylation domain-containing protein/prepilin-type processing-associated H-X9-DG protein
MFLEQRSRTEQAQTRNRRNGFTLIELLVVIAIISLLAAILFPVFARARENARRASCQSNLKQIALGVKQYTQDYDERYPIYWSDADGLLNSSTHAIYFNATTTSDDTVDKGWTEMIQPYVKSTQIFQCPSEKYRSRAAQGLKGNGEYFSDYWYYVYFSNTSAGVVGRPLSSVTYPAMTVMIGEGGSKVSGTSAFSLLNGADSSGGNTTPNTAIINVGELQRHLDGSNFLFADGHVKWFKGESGTTTSQIWDDDLKATTTPALGSVPSFSF